MRIDPKAGDGIRPGRKDGVLNAPSQIAMPALAKPINALVAMPLAEQRGGAELTLLHLIEHGRGLGVNWSVAFFEDGPMVTAVRQWGVPAFIVPTGRMRQPHRMVLAIRSLGRLIRDHKIDVVLSWMGKGQLYGGTAAWLTGTAAVWFQHGLPDPPSWQDRAATNLPAKMILTCSQTTAEAQKKVRPKRPIGLVHPGVDLTRYDASRQPTPADCRRELRLPHTGPLIGLVGRLQSWKGMHHLVDAMPAVLEKYPDAHAVIVGGPHAFEPDYPAELNKRISQRGLKDKIILAGLQTAVPQWMQAMDVMVHASDAEPFGMVVIEAMALGKRVIATATAGPSEIITPGVDGVLWPPGQPEMLADALLATLRQTEAEAKNMSDLARERAAHFDVRHYARRVAELTIAATLKNAKVPAVSSTVPA